MSRTVLRSTFVLIFCLALITNSNLFAQSASGAKAPSVAAQPTAASNQGMPVFTSKTQLVLVPVLVKGKNGEHISGLGREVFKIEEGGKARTVATIEEVKPVAAGAKVSGGPRLEGHSNFNFEDAPRGHLTIVVLDLLNTPYLHQGDGRRQLIEMVAKVLPANEATVVFALGVHGLRQLYAPTTDTAGLLASMRGIKGATEAATNGQTTSGVETLSNSEFSNTLHMGEGDGEPRSALKGGGELRSGLHGGGDQQDTGWTTLKAFSQIASAYSTIPGRKTLIWASGGMSGQLPIGISRTTMQNKIEDIWRELNAAGVAVYSVDVSRLAGFAGTLTPYRVLAERERSLKRFADETGGKWCAGTSIDIGKCLSKAFDDAGSYYLLGYYLPTDDQKPGWRKLKVKVASDGAHVRAREGFYVTGAKESAQDRQRKLLDALTSPVELTGVRFNVREVPSAPGVKPVVAGASRHEFMIGVLGSSVKVDELNGNAVKLSVVAVAFGKDDRDHGSIDHEMAANVKPELLEKFRKTGLSTRQSLDLPRGIYTVKFAVRDNLTGEIGTVEYPLEVK